MPTSEVVCEVFRKMVLRILEFWVCCSPRIAEDYAHDEVSGFQHSQLGQAWRGSWYDESTLARLGF